MTLRKKTVDNSVRYVPKSEKPKTVKAGSLPRKQNRNPSQNNKKFLKNVTASGFGYLTNSIYTMLIL